jgi:hypothetical protein
MLTRAERFGPAPIIAIHVLAMIGVLFWLSTIVSTFISDSSNKWFVAVVGLVLGGAHVAISRFTSLHSTRAFVAMWFVFLGDSLLAIFVDWQAIALVLFTVVLLLLTRVRSARIWFAPPMRT